LVPEEADSVTPQSQWKCNELRQLWYRDHVRHLSQRNVNRGAIEGMSKICLTIDDGDGEFVKPGAGVGK